MNEGGEEGAETGLRFRQVEAWQATRATRAYIPLGCDPCTGHPTANHSLVAIALAARSSTHSNANLFGARPFVLPL